MTPVRERVERRRHGEGREGLPLPAVPGRAVVREQAVALYRQAAEGR